MYIMHIYVDIDSYYLIELHKLYPDDKIVYEYNSRKYMSITFANAYI